MFLSKIVFCYLVAASGGFSIVTHKTTVLTNITIHTLLGMYCDNNIHNTTRVTFDL